MAPGVVWCPWLAPKKPKLAVNFKQIPAKKLGKFERIQILAAETAKIGAKGAKIEFD